MALIEVKSVSLSFGGLKAVNSCSLMVEKGSITGLIGPNGAGKTTLFNIIAGFLPADTGEVFFNGEKINGLPSYQIALKGLARTFQAPHGFPEMTVLETMMVVPKNQYGEKFWTGLILGAKVKEQEKANKEKALALLETIGIVKYRNELVGNLSSGDARMLEVVRQLMLEPQILLLDEPAAGVNPAMQDALIALLRRLNNDGLTLLVIDHNLGFIMELCDVISVMYSGEIITQGTPKEVSKNKQVIDVYLGVVV